MMVSRHQRRTREVTGPAPHSVAIYAKNPSNKPLDFRILDRRRHEERTQRAEDLLQNYCDNDLKNEWERKTDKAIQRNTVNRRVQDMLQAKEFSVEDRREKLRRLFYAEEKQYLAEMASKEETVIERQAKMRAKAKALKEKRESERQEYVQQKLEEQWRSQCEELRSTMSKRLQDEISADRMEQLKVKDEMAAIQKEEERMYADMWYADMAAKAKREEEDTKRRMEGNRDCLAVLQKQMAALEAKKVEEKKLLEEEARLQQEQNALRALEEQQMLEEKRRKQAETRQMYTDSLNMKRQREAKELQEQLAFDMKILEQLLEESRNEAMEIAQRKRELKEEDKRYRAYLQQLKLEEAAREKELERLCDLEVEKMWDKRIKQWKLEKAARKQLLAEVMASRRLQLEEKLQRNEQKQRETARERDELLAQIEENKRLEKEANAAKLQKALMHQNDLLGQMDYNRRQLVQAACEEDRMFKSQQEAEKEYRRKLEHALQNPEMDRIHPIRRTSGLRGGSAPPSSIFG